MISFIKKFSLLNILLILFLVWAIDQLFTTIDLLILSKTYGLILTILFLVIIVFIVLTFFNIFFNKKKFIIYFSVIYISLFSVSFVFDIYKDFIEKKNTEKIYEKKFNKNKNLKFDTRKRKEVVEDLRKTNDRAFSTMSPFFLIRNELKNLKILPLSGISNVTTVLCNESGEYAIYISDKIGFNNPNNIYKFLDSEQIILIGDSWIHGACVQPNKTLSTNLRKKNLNIINLAYSGNGPLLELATLTEYISFFKPKKVIWFYYENDLRELALEKKSQILMSYINEENFSQNLYYKQDLIDKFWESLINKYDYLDVLGGNIKITKRNFVRQISRKFERSLKLKSFYDILKKYLNVRLSVLHNIEELNQLDLFKEIIKKAKKITNENNAELYFVYLSSLNSVQKSSPKSHKEVLKIIKELNIPMLDFYNTLKKTENPEKYFPFGMPFVHFNAQGVKKLSDEIILEMDLLSETN